jgi:site-specific DNA-methyltransferase (adenine-specific)
MNQNSLFDILGIKENEKGSLNRVAGRLQIQPKSLKYYNDNGLLPSSPDLEKVLGYVGITKLQLMLQLGIYTQEIKDLIASYSNQIADLIPQDATAKEGNKVLGPTLSTQFGTLYQGDCMTLMATQESESVDLIFADPPFNLSKLYPSGINDDLKHREYLKWCESWLDECVRILKPGGSLFLWNLPKWNTYFAEYLNHRLTFRHWISADIKFSLPIQGRLYPSHYSLLYYCKGTKPKTFHPDRLPMEICPKCKTDLKDYGGYKDKMNPAGINLTDVWMDIPPVRHSKYKKRKGANELSIKLLDRIIEMASEPGDLVFDPFGGSGSTYVTAELKERRWLGVELGPTEEIVDRFQHIESERDTLNKYRNKYNKLFSVGDVAERKKKGMWTHETFLQPSTLTLALF